MTRASPRFWIIWLAACRRWGRSHAVGHVAVAIVVGALAGASVTAMTAIAEVMHVAIYGIAFDERLSAQARVSPIAAFAAMGLGGFVLGLFEFWRRRRKARPSVDPVEANALRGGRLSLGDGFVVVGQTLLSNGCGASVGLEAGYAQIGSAIGSKLGLALKLRRPDQRMLLGCGAAGAIAAAFAAPLTGAFYAFELIIGEYSLANAGPVIAAALAGSLTVRTLGGAPYNVTAPPVQTLGLAQHAALIVLGLVSAALGVGAMRAAALFERAFLASRLPVWARPVAGGCLLAALAAYTPQVLGAGHGALGLDISLRLGMGALTVLIALKLVACLVSLASGFRGGLFFASLFVGALLGKLFVAVLAVLAPSFALDPTASLFAGMGTLSVAIVGGPLTMTFLVLESSGDLGLAGGVLAACIGTSVAVRATFGFSFSTWRLHLRGENVRSAHDIGWLRELTVGRMMDRDPAVAPSSQTLDEFRAAHPLGSAHYVVLKDEFGRYAGLVAVPEAHAEPQKPLQSIAELARLANATLAPDMQAKEALAAFEAAQSEILAVVDPGDGSLLGALGEAYAARRFAQALNRSAQSAAENV